MNTVTEKSAWEQAVARYAPESGAYLHAWAWGEMERALGHQVDRIEVNGVMGAVVTKHLPLGKQYGYVPRGPLAPDANGARAWVQRLRDARSEDLFLRVDPLVDMKELPRSYVTRDVQPRTTLITRLTGSTEALLEQMHQKTRYNIRVAQKRQVEVDLTGGTLEEFYELLSRTVARHGIRAHNKEHYAALLKHLDGTDGNPKAWVAVARHGSAVVVANIMVDYNGVRTYLHGASSYDDRRLMAPYLLHIELMKDAKAKGINAYDWGGIAPSGATKHPLAGVTRFKRGFGGEEIGHPASVDLVIQPQWYRLYKLVQRLRGR